MQPEEWQVLAAVIENAWRGDFDDERAAAYYALLQGYDADDVERALHLIVRSGNPFVPAVAEIITAIESAERAGIPTWPEALSAVRRILPRYSRRPDDGLAKLGEIHPHLASWVAAYGWGRLALEPIDDPQYGGAVLKRLEDSYREHVERQEDRRRQGLAIETVKRGRLVGPRKPDFAGALGAGGAS